MSDNPLLMPNRLPPFTALVPEHIEPAFKQLTESNLTALKEQLNGLDEPTWDNLVAPIEAREDFISQAWAPVSHLNSVANNDDMRAAYEKAIALLTEYNTVMGQNRDLFLAYEKLAESPAFINFSQAQKQSIHNAIRDFKLSGVDLEGEAKQRYADIQKRLSELSNQFSNNVLDATHGWYKHITDEAELAGLPQSAVDGAKQSAESKGLEGWVLTLDGPVYLTVMTQADSRELRKEIYTAYMTKASDQGPSAGQWDNTKIIEEILALRQELSKLLGFDNYAERSLAPKMAESTEQVLSFLQELGEKTKPFAQKELDELRDWVKETHELTELEVWDVPYYSEKLKEAKYSISQEALRPYFTLPTVLEGLFDVAHKLFGIKIYEESVVETWHPDAKFFAIELDGKPIAHFYMDLYAREGKRGGAWMADCRVRRKTKDGLQLPIAFMVCNFNPPVGDKPCLLTHNEVTTLFHEFGHGLHHMLTKIDVAAVSGINGVAWDAVELPSQFMENFCWDPQVLKSLSAHWESGESLPDEMIGKLLSAKNFQSALFMVRQLEFATFDFRLHMEFGREGFKGVQALLDEVRNQMSVVKVPDFNRFQHGFTHIFAGGYAAGYYSYKWAEVLSADAFSAFEEKGLFDQATGKKFLEEILQKGGSQDAMTLFKNFRGREPKIDALLKHSGLAA